MTSDQSDDGKLRVEHRSEAAGDDWYRYGLSRRGGEDQGPRDALGRPIQDEARRPAAPDDFYIQYRHETSQRTPSTRTRRSPRFIANVATVVVVIVVGVAAMGLALATSPGPVVPSPSPTRPAASPTIAPSSFPVAESSAGPKAAHIAALIDLPVQVVVTDRQRPLDDGGTTMYLTSPKGGVALDPSRGVIRTVLGGAAFSGGGVRRAVLDSGLWVSSWPAGTKQCGPTCWAQSTTYRLDPVAGTVSKKLTATYLLGAADDGVWVAAGKVVELLDPATGAVLSSTTWKGTAEPRIGCSALWSFTPGAKASTLVQVDPKTGAALGSSELDPTVTYGPIDIQGRCWVMNGSSGATLGSTTMTWLNADGTTQATFEYPGLSMVVLDGEFWSYSSNSEMQRVDPTSGVGFGAAYVLPVGPPGGDPQWFFASVGKMWMISGGQLAEFDIPTGPGNAAG
jgi:hypothetical protein